MKNVYIILAICALIGVAIFVGFFNQETIIDTTPLPISNPPTSTTTSTPTPTQTITPYGEVKVSLNQTVIFADFSLKPLKVESDSRCPSGVQCVWAGTVTLQIELRDTSGTITKIIELNKEAIFKSYVISLKEVLPNKKVNENISDAQYKFTLSVQKKTAVTPPGKCYVGGCSSQICSDKEGIASTCEYREEYACYKGAVCARQSDGLCGWTQTAELKMCIQEAKTNI